MRTIAAIFVASVAAASFAVGLGAEPAAAVVIHDVTTTDDHDDGNCDPVDCSLREAVIEAAADGDASEIQLDTTTYELDLCAGGDLEHVAEEALTVTGNGASIVQTCPGERVFDHDGDSLVTLSTLTISGGQATESGGGVIRLRDGQLAVTDSFLTDNEATGGGSGGAIDVLGSQETVTVTSSTISNNAAGDTGGAIRNASGGSTVIQRSTLSGNSGISGGAIDGADVAVHNSTIAGNEARDGSGGGVFGNGIEIIGSTVVDNTATQGGANVHSDVALTLAGSIIADGHSRPDCGGPGVRTSGGHNVGGDNSCGPDEPTDIRNVGKPLLGPLVVTTGDHATRVPLAGSPARDLVPNAVCVGADKPVFTPDQRGFLRPQPTGADACDSGAVEGNADDIIADALVNRPGEPFVGAGVFSTDGTGQKASSTKRAGRTATYAVRAQNASPLAIESITVGATPASGPFRTRFFVAGVNVTDTVNAGTQEALDLPPGSSEKVTVKVKVKGSASPGAKLVLLVTATDSADTSTDTVKLKTRAR